MDDGVGEGSAPMDLLAAETLAGIILCFTDCRDVGRCALVSRRFHKLIDGDPSQRVWRHTSLAAAARNGLDGPWIAAAAKIKGWAWIGRAMEPLPEGGAGIGYTRRGTSFAFGAFDAHVKHGYAVDVCCRGEWFHGLWRSGIRHGHGIAFYPSGDSFEGDWRGGVVSGQGTYTWPSQRQRHVGEWLNSTRHGYGIAYNCCCGRHDARHYGIGGAPHRPPVSSEGRGNGAIGRTPFGCVTYANWDGDQIEGEYIIGYCSGDVCYGTRSTGGDPATERCLFTCSPDCPDPRFRSLRIEANAWVRSKHPCADGLGVFSLVYPDPVSSSDAFGVYRDYFERGFLPVTEGDRATVAAVLGAAAKRAPLSRAGM